MANSNKGYKKALSVVLPAGALGASLLLALAATDVSAATTQNPTATGPVSGDGVSARLQAIRSGVSDMSGSAVAPTEDAAKATPSWWGNGGWGRWRMGWGNGGWGNGGWHNWHNWGNGGGWPNGWHNFWHNW